MLAAASTSERRPEAALLDDSMTSSMSVIPAPPLHAATGADAITEDVVRRARQKFKWLLAFDNKKRWTDLRLFVQFRWSM